MKKIILAGCLLMAGYAHADRALTLYDNATNQFQLKTPAQILPSYRLVLPSSLGSSNQVMQILSVSGSTGTLGWVTLIPGGGGGSIAVGTGTTGGWTGTLVSSPTQVLLANQFQFQVTLQGLTTAFFQINCASITCLGQSPPASAIASGALGALVMASSVSVNSIYPGAVSAGTYGNITLPAANVAAGSLGASVIASSIGVGAVGLSQTSNLFPPSLSTGVVGTLQAAQAPAFTGDVTNSAGSLAMTASATQGNMRTFTSSLTVTGAGGVGVNYNLNLGSMTGSGLSNCGDTVHALGWSSTTNLFSCVNVTGSGGGGGSSSLAVSAGVVRSSPTTDIIFPDSQFVGSVSVASMTVSLNTSSVTLYGPNIPAAAISAGSLGASVIASSVGASTVGFGQLTNVIPISLSTAATGTLQAAQEPAHTGDVTNAAGSLAMTAYNTQANIKTFTSSLTVTGAGGINDTYNLNIGSITGAGLTTCSAGTNGVSWNSTTNLFGCNTYSAATFGAVTSVSGTSPINSSGGATPAISLSQTIGQVELFTSSMTVNTNVAISSNAVLSGATFYNNAIPVFNSFSGAGLSTCGDATHALAWTSGTGLFSCQNVTGSGGGGGASPVALGTGTASGYTGVITSTGGVALVIYDSGTESGVLQGGSTFYHRLLPATGDVIGTLGSTNHVLAATQGNVKAFSSALTFASSLTVNSSIQVSSNAILPGATFYNNAGSVFVATITAPAFIGNGTGNMSITENGITGQIVISSTTATAGQCAQFTSSSSVQGVTCSAGGTVTSVTGTSPINSSGGTTPAISLSQTIAQTELFTSSITANTNISISSNVITPGATFYQNGNINLTLGSPSTNLCTDANNKMTTTACNNGTVTSVTGTSPINATAGATPAVSLSQTIAQTELFTSSITASTNISVSSNAVLPGATFYANSQPVFNAFNGAGLTTCGDGTHALNWTAGAFGCQAITAGGGGGGAAPIAFGTGTTSGYTGVITSTGGVALVLFDSGTMSGVLQGGGTYYLQQAALTGDITAAQGSAATVAAATQGNIKTFTAPITLSSSLTVNSGASLGATIITSTGSSNVFFVSSATTGIGFLSVSSTTASSPYDFLLTLASPTVTGPTIFGVELNGHIVSSGTTPTVGTTCGTTPSISAGSTDAWGSITWGGAATTCDLVFVSTHKTPPYCIEEAAGAAFVQDTAITTSSMTFTLSASLTGSTVTWHCMDGGAGF